MDALEEFIKIIESEFPDDRLTYQKSIPTFHPESTDEAAAFFRLVNLSNRQTYITGFGNNIDPIGSPFTEMVIIRTDRLNQVGEISESGLHVRLGAGYPLMEANQELRPRHLFMPHSGLPYVGSVGGATAVNLSAELNGVDLPIKKFILQVEAVTGDGQVLTAGSPSLKARGGPDIAKIFAPSWGLLGLVVSATFRVVPLDGRDEFDGMRMKKIERDGFLAALRKDNDDPDAVYSRKIKEKFDPGNVLPIMPLN